MALTQASYYTPWVHGDQPTFGDGLIYPTNVVHVNVLRLTFCLSVKLSKSILCDAKQWKCKFNYNYMVVHGFGGGGGLGGLGIW